MTKEELEKEAEEKYSEVDREFIACQDEGEVFNIGYVLGAEPREKRIAELEKENAELKGIKDVATLIRANNDTVVTLMQLNNKLVSKSQQLTKAIELLKWALHSDPEHDNLADFDTKWKEAEQFLSEVEK